MQLPPDIVKPGLQRQVVEGPAGPLTPCVECVKEAQQARASDENELVAQRTVMNCAQGIG